jgi:hypothetical protein
MNERKTAKPRGLRRWWQFGLVFLFFLITLACVTAGSVGWLNDRLESQRKAVERITELGGGAYFDCQRTATGEWRDQLRPSAPAWAKGWLADDLFGRIVFVDLTLSGVQDEDLILLRGCPDVEVLDLDHTTIGDAGLYRLRALSRLQHLSLNGTAVRNSGLRELSVIKSLQQLDLEDTLIGDEGLAHLQDLKGLRRVLLRRTKVTTAGVAALQKALPDCEIVN